MNTKKAGLIEKIQQQYWNLRSFWIPPELGKVPTMLTPEECRMLVWIATEWPQGRGAVIDLGSFLGGSTAHLTYGLNKACPGQAVHAYDQFEIGDDHKKPFLYDWGYPELQGNSMRHLFDDFVKPFGNVIAHTGRIENASWTGEPIEILFVDIMKGWAEAGRVMRTFYPHLVPDESLVIHQDFQHYQQPWVPATTQYLRDYLRFIGYTAENSAIFLCTRTITLEIIDKAIDACMSDVEVTKRLIVQAHDKFPHARQREAMWQHIDALNRNPGAQNSWDLTLG